MIGQTVTERTQVFPVRASLCWREAQVLLDRPVVGIGGEAAARFRFQGSTRCQGVTPARTDAEKSVVQHRPWKSERDSYIPTATNPILSLRHGDISIEA